MRLSGLIRGWLYIALTAVVLIGLAWAVQRSVLPLAKPPAAESAAPEAATVDRDPAVETDAGSEPSAETSAPDIAGPDPVASTDQHDEAGTTPPVVEKTERPRPAVPLSAKPYEPVAESEGPPSGVPAAVAATPPAALPEADPPADRCALVEGAALVAAPAPDRGEVWAIRAPAGAVVRAVVAGEAAQIYNSPYTQRTIVAVDAARRLSFLYGGLVDTPEALVPGGALICGQVLGRAAPRAAGAQFYFAVRRIDDPQRWWEGELLDPQAFLEPVADGGL